MLSERASRNEIAAPIDATQRAIRLFTERARLCVRALVCLCAGCVLSSFILIGPMLSSFRPPYPTVPDAIKSFIAAPRHSDGMPRSDGNADDDVLPLGHVRACGDN